MNDELVMNQSIGRGAGLPKHSPKEISAHQAWLHPNKELEVILLFFV